MTDIKNRRLSLKFIIGILWITFIVLGICRDLKFFYFDGVYNSNSILFYCLMKCIFILIIIGISIWLYKFIINYSIKKKLFLQKIKFVVPFLIIYGLLLIVLWPGNWGVVGDEFQVYMSVKNLRVWPDQGLLSSVFMILSLMVYPSPGIICLLQGLISALLVGNILYMFHEEFKNRKVTVFLGILLVSFPALTYVFCPIRAWLYSVLLLYFIESIYFFFRKKKYNKSSIWKLTFCCALIVNYRSEGMILLLLYPIALFVCADFIENKKKTIVNQILLIIFSIILVKGLTIIGNGQTLRQHSGIGLVCPLSIVLADDIRYGKIDEMDIHNINQVFDIETLRKYPSKTVAWQGKSRERDYDEPTKEEMASFMKSATKILINNWPIYLECKWEAMKSSLGIYPYFRTIWPAWTFDTLSSWRENGGKDIPGEVLEDFRVIDENEARIVVSSLLISPMVISGIDLFYLLYAFWLPCLFMFIYLVVAIARKRWWEAVFAFGLVIQFLLVVFTAPCQYQMYYLAFYFCGWYLLTRLIAERKKR